MRYSEELIDEVRSRNDIVEVISGYIQLKKSGANYFGLCPFHGEKTPSFSVSPEKQMYHCFGCGASGNVFSFLMQYEQLSFPEAVQRLADRAGIALPKRELTGKAKEEADLRQKLFEVNKLAANYFYIQLKSPKGGQGLSYFTGRALTDATIRHFGLGYSNKTSDDLYRFLRGRGYADAVLKETGLFTYTEKGVFDKFWNRVMFPIMDANSRVIGFGGRVMGDGEPKYLNSPETRIFEKSRNLYGLNFARSSRKKYMLLCEGYMDVIAMHQAGFTNSVASLGTSLTEQHAAILRRYTDTVILTYDSDGAGVKAALRAIPMLRNVGISTKVLNMRPHKDPDEFIKAEGREAFEQRIAEARNSFLFEIDVLKRDLDMDDPEQRTRFYRETARKLLEFDEPLERESYIDAVAREFFIPKDELAALVNRMGLSYGTGSRPFAGANARGSAGMSEQPVKMQANPRKRREDGIRQSERLLLGMLINDPTDFDKIRGIIGPADFQDPVYRKAAADVFAQHEKSPDGKVLPAQLLSRYQAEGEDAQEIAGLFSEGMAASLRESGPKALTETVRKIRKNSLDVKLREAGDIREMQEIIRQQAELANLDLG